MISRYQNKWIAKIWNDQSKITRWTLVERVIAKARAKVGDITAAISQKEWEILYQKLYTPYLSEIAEEEKIVQHDMAAFVNVLERHIKSPEGRFVHFGLTSSDIIDTANAIAYKSSIDIVLKLLTVLIQEIEQKVIEYNKLFCLGRTHGKTGLTIKIVDRFNNFYHSIIALKRQLLILRSETYGKISGAMGNYSTVSKSVEREALKMLKLRSGIIIGQCINRQYHASLIFLLSSIGCELSRMATNIRLLSQDGINEMSENFDTNQYGSSAMPHKKNPISCEKICGMSRLLNGFVVTSLENILLWNERDISHSSVERIIIPDAFHLICHMTETMSKILSSLFINKKQIEQNIHDNNNRHNSEAELNKLIIDGMSRANAYSKIKHIFLEKESNES